MHRRSHMSHTKIKTLPHSSSDAPRNLSSLQSNDYSCSDCADANIKKPSHSGHLRTPADRPGKLHVDLKQFSRSIQGYFYVAFFIDEHTRYVWVRFLRKKSEIIQATASVITEFNATVGVPILEGRVTAARARVLHIHSDHE